MSKYQSAVVLTEYEPGRHTDGFRVDVPHGKEAAFWSDLEAAHGEPAFRQVMHPLPGWRADWRGYVTPEGMLHVELQTEV